MTKHVLHCRRRHGAVGGAAAAPLLAQRGGARGGRHAQHPWSDPRRHSHAGMRLPSYLQIAWVLL